MKNHINWSKAQCAIFVWLVAMAASTAQAQYAVHWFKIAGGGGTATGGAFAVRGTIGQHKAGATLTSGPYSVTGGFWVLPKAVQSVGAPVLSIVRAALGQATISWTPVTSGFVLEESLTLAPGSWTASPSGRINPVTVPATPPRKFYRLHKL